MGMASAYTHARQLRAERSRADERQFELDGVERFGENPLRDVAGGAGPEAPRRTCPASSH